MKKIMEHRSGKLEQGRPMLLKLLERGAVTEADVVALRREVFAQHAPSRIEIEDLFAIDAVAQPKGEAWAEFFVEAVTDFVVWGQRPTGLVEEADAHWLLAKVDAAKTVSSFAVLVNILDQAHRVPRWFPAAVRSRAVAGWPGLLSHAAPAGVAASCAV
ncbi:MAG TPA: hypothetical protein VH414_02585 [Lichenihabitans sp.]|nr:hypothetical protein [Lichenihabitans sp.]